MWYEKVRNKLKRKRWIRVEKNEKVECELI